jgi:hypothetical protein
MVGNLFVKVKHVKASWKFGIVDVFVVSRPLPWQVRLYGRSSHYINKKLCISLRGDRMGVFIFPGISPLVCRVLCPLLLCSISLTASLRQQSNIKLFRYTFAYNIYFQSSLSHLQFNQAIHYNPTTYFHSYMSSIHP